LTGAGTSAAPEAAGVSGIARSEQKKIERGRPMTSIVAKNYLLCFLE
jgi:hypothetical protein